LGKIPEKLGKILEILSKILKNPKKNKYLSNIPENLGKNGA